MSGSKPIKNLLSQEMDRRQFLGFLGAAVLVVTGVSGVVGGLSRLSGKSGSGGYGASAYGGSPAKSAPKRVRLG